MAQKIEKKEILRQQIVSAAKTYSQQLAGKVFLYVYGDEYFELLFQTSQFLHLTGVSTKLSAREFYNNARKGTLDSKQFGFTHEHSFAGAKKKLPCLNRLPELTTNMVCVLKDMTTATLTYKIGVTNLEFTLGLTENIDAKNNKINDWFLPRTLRVKDKAIENSGDGEIVDFIFVRDASAQKYSTLTFADKSKPIPQSVAHLIDSEFYKNVAPQAVK
jgi:hypothetical protein